MGEKVIRWRPTGRFTTTGRPVLEQVKVEKTTPEENIPPTMELLPEELKPQIKRTGVGNYNADITAPDD